MVSEVICLIVLWTILKPDRNVRTLIVYYLHYTPLRVECLHTGTSTPFNLYIYVNDLSNISKVFKCVLFADDTNAFTLDKSLLFLF